jgi:hypothetical protein
MAAILDVVGAWLLYGYRSDCWPALGGCCERYASTGSIGTPTEAATEGRAELSPFTPPAPDRCCRVADELFRTPPMVC